MRLTFHQRKLYALIRVHGPVAVESMPSYNERGPKVNVIGVVWANMAALGSLEHKGLIVKDDAGKWRIV